MSVPEKRRETAVMIDGPRRGAKASLTHPAGTVRTIHIPVSDDPYWWADHAQLPAGHIPLCERYTPCFDPSGTAARDTEGRIKYHYAETGLYSGPL